jgi:hypothetical protein
MTSSSPRSLRKTFKNLLNHGLRAAAIALALTCLVPVAHVQAQTSEESGVRDIRSLNATEKQQLLERIRKALRHVLDTTRIDSFKGRYTPLKVKFRTGPRNEELVIDLGAENGPDSDSADSEELSTQLANALTDILDKSGISYPDIVHEFDGRDWYYYHPEQLQNDREYERNMRQKGGQSAIPSQGAKIVVSAMHGYYLRYFEGIWQLQRPELSNGIYEDFITPTFVDPLSNWLYTRSAALIYLPRSQSTDPHPVTGFPWWQMDGREYLKVTYPLNDEIWDKGKIPKKDPNKWEYNKDINSRPLFANFIGADALFNLHTNASDTDPTASGTRAFVTRNRAEDLALANNVLCGMKELIHAQDVYQTFRVASQAVPRDDLGENTLARMPAVVIEVAFHTNAGDAAALQDPVFVDAAMKGVEKGFRLQAEGKVCKPFKITSIPDVTAQRPNSVNVPVNFEGFPYFPVTLTVEYTSCPAGETCTGGTVVHNTPEDSPFVFSVECSGSSSTPSTSGWRSYMTDADGVKTNAVAHSLTCLPNTGKAANGKPSMQVVSAEL